MAPSKAYPTNASGASSPSDTSMADVNSIKNGANEDENTPVGLPNPSCPTLLLHAATRTMKEIS